MCSLCGKLIAPLVAALVYTGANFSNWLRHLIRVRLRGCHVDCQDDCLLHGSMGSRLGTVESLLVDLRSNLIYIRCTAINRDLLHRNKEFIALYSCVTRDRRYRQIRTSNLSQDQDTGVVSGASICASGASCRLTWRQESRFPS